MGVPLTHPFQIGIFSEIDHPANLGYPHDLGHLRIKIERNVNKHMLKPMPEKCEQAYVFKQIPAKNTHEEIVLT